mmetsp:Transcript_36251/g.91528  ORF Transcript_36251/g.91528 Transcript_36251/m.91528 type:complete len:245 (+) Transcript_36251:3091-3825(+)
MSARSGAPRRRRLSQPVTASAPSVASSPGTARTAGPSTRAAPACGLPASRPSSASDARKMTGGPAGGGFPAAANGPSVPSTIGAQRRPASVSTELRLRGATSEATNASRRATAAGGASWAQASLCAPSHSLTSAGVVSRAAPARSVCVRSAVNRGTGITASGRPSAASVSSSLGSCAGRPSGYTASPGITQAPPAQTTGERARPAYTRRARPAHGSGSPSPAGHSWKKPSLGPRRRAASSSTRT